MKDTAIFHTIQRLNLPQDGYIPEEMFFRGPGRVEYHAAAAGDCVLEGASIAKPLSEQATSAAAEDRAPGSASVAESVSEQVSSATAEDPTPEPASITVPAGETVRFDTYFNLLSLFKWRQYTSIRDLRVEITLKGDAVVTLYGISIDAAGDSEPETDLTEERIRENTSVVISQEIHAATAETCRLFQTDDLEALPEFLYLEVSAGGCGAVIGDIAYRACADTYQDLNIAACFCTYRREEDIRRNIANLEDGIIRNETAFLHDRLHVFVADNGNTLPLDRFQNNDRIHVFYNRNYGGSAGFTRCMIESCIRYNGAPFTHVVLMDDDALITAPVVERLGRFLTVLKPQYAEYMIGGFLLEKEKPWIQQKMGLHYDVRLWGQRVSMQTVDLRPLDNILRNEMVRHEEIDNNGWWLTCIPASFITKDNLPMPFFFHHDDTEYGLRNDGRFLRLNGICVWHPKENGISKQKPYIKYYNTRNALIIQAAYYPEASAFRMILCLFKEYVLTTVNYKYPDYHYFRMGIEHFYKGIDWFQTIDPEELNRQLLHGISNETCHLTQDEIRQYGIIDNDQDALEHIDMGSRKRRKLLNWLRPAGNTTRVYSVYVEWKHLDFYGAKRVYVVDPDTGEGYVFRKSYRKALASLAGCLTTAVTIAVRHHKTYRQWHDNINTFRSYSFWEKYLGISDSGASHTAQT